MIEERFHVIIDWSSIGRCQSISIDLSYWLASIDRLDFWSSIVIDLRTFAAKTSNVPNFFKLPQEWDIVERIRKTKKMGVTMLLLQLGSIENDQIWSFFRCWLSIRYGGENTFRVSKTKKFWTFLVKDEWSSNYKSVLAPVKRWNRPLEALEGQAWPIYLHATEWKTLFLKMF